MVPTLETIVNRYGHDILRNGSKCWPIIQIWLPLSKENAKCYWCSLALCNRCHSTQLIYYMVNNYALKRRNPYGERQNN